MYKRKTNCLGKNSLKLSLEKFAFVAKPLKHGKHVVVVAKHWKGIPLRGLFFLFLYSLKFEGLKWTRQNDYKCPYWKCYRANNDSRQRSIFFLTLNVPSRVSIVLFVLWLENMRAGVFKRNFRYFPAFLRNDILLRGAKAKHVI